MSYYIGATGEYIWEELLENTTSNVIIANNINFDAGPLTDAIQETITDALGTAVGELIAPVTEVPSATGVGVVALTALGLLSYYKLNRTAVQDVDSMVYSADYASILTPGMFDDRVRIRYDTNQFSNVFYNVDNVKKGEILTSRINLLPIGTNDVDLYTSTGKIGIGTTPLTPLHIYTGGNAATNIIRLETPIGGSSSIEFKRGTDLDIYADFRLIGYNGLFKLQYENNELAYGDTGTDIISASKTQITINKPTTLIDNVGIGTYPATQLHIYNATSPTINIQSIADGTPIVEFMRGTSSDVNKDYRFISQSDTFKLQFQDATTYYFDANNQLISINATDTIIHKQTEFKANVLIGGDTRTIGYVGIGTTAATALHVYTAAANILRLQTAPVNGTNSIEFMRGNSTDPLTDYRLLTDTAGKFKIQYANNLLAYGDADTDLIELSTTNTTIYKPTEFKGNVGIGTTPHATYKVDVNGTINATAFRGDGANITALNEANLVLTTTKLYNNFNQTNFAIIDNKIDITPNYSINITDYDSQTLFNTSVERKYKGKMTANYDDRNGVYKLITTNNRTDNVAVLNYKVGDKISIRNTATVANDYLLESGSRYYNSLLLIKRPNNIPLNWAVNDAHNVLLYEWFSSDGLEGRPEARVRTPTNRYFPFTTVMTFLIEAGYNYYLCKLYNSVEVSGSSLIVVASGYGDDYNDFNRAFGAGQTFKLQITGSTFADDYLPTEYIGADIGIASDRRLGGVKKGRGVAIDETTGALDATPVSVDLINSMNTSHFTNNTGTNKIDISSTYVAPSATKLATARNIAGVSFDGSGAIDIPYGNLSSIPATWGEGQIPSLPISKITNLQSTLDGKAPTSHTHVIGDVTNLQSTLDGKAPTSHTHTIANITNLQTTLDGKAPTSHSHVIADITNLQTTLDGKAPTSHTHVIGDVTNLQTTLDGKAPTSHTHVIGDVTNLQTTLDGKQATLTAGTNITITGTTISSSATFTPTSTNLISVFNATQFVNNVGTSKIDIDVNWKPTTCSIADSAMQLVSSRNIAGVAFNGTASIAIPFANIDGLTTELATKQATINSTAGQLIIGNGNGATTTNAGLTWNGGNTLNTTNLAVSTYATITRELTSVLSGGVDMFELRNNATNNLRFNQTWIGANDMRWQMIQKSNNVDYPVINFRNGKISVGTFSNPAYQLELVGDINITGAYRVNGTVLKPANAVLADTATALATSRNIAGVAFNGTADIAIDYFALTNRPIILQPTTTNLQLVSGYTLSVPGNMAVGTTAIPTNILQVGAGGRLRISNGTTDYTLLGTIDTDGSTNTSIVISGTTRSTNAGNIQYLATASGGSHIFYTASATTRMTISSSGVNVNNDLGVSGNVGIGVAPATYKVNVNGDINVSGAFRINGTALSTGSRWSVGAVATNIYYNSGNVGIGTSTLSSDDGNTAFALPDATLYVKGGASAGGTCDVVIRGGVAGGEQGKARLWLAADASHSSYIENIHTGSGNTQLTFGTANGNVLPAERMRITNAGNVGIANTSPLGTLHLGDASKANNDGHIIFAKCTTLGSTRICRVGYNNSFDFVIGDIGGGNTLGTWFEQFKINYSAPANCLVINGSGFITTGVITQGAFPVGIKFNVYGSDNNGVAAQFKHPNDTQGIGIRYDGLTGMNTNQSMIFRVSGSGQVATYINGTERLNVNGGGVSVNTDLYVVNQIYGGFYAVSTTNTDYLVVQQNYNSGQFASNFIKVGFGTFTGFHRCYTDDELYNNESEETIDLFKNNYMGRVVIATGKIKTDFSRKKEVEPEADPEPVIDSITGLPIEPAKLPKKDEDEWYIGIDKDGISVEDAVPVIALSRQKKDKRVFGVLGEPKRSTNNKDRLVVNSVGEGAICVANTNGNIENGDYIQSSDLLGYGEKQDDDLLHNYTIGKATIDCDFQLDSPYYQCHEIENGVRIAFIACTYHCG